MIAAVGDTPYRVVLFLHILSAMVAFAPAFTHPILTNQSKSLGEGHQGVMGFLSGNARRIYAPALIVTGILGFGLQGMSSGAWSFTQFWMIAAMIVWLAMNGVLHALIIPNEKKMSEGDPSAQRLLDIGGQVITVLLLVMLWLMIFKPGV